MFLILQDDGAKPLDVQRVCELETHDSPPEAAQRKLGCAYSWFDPSNFHYRYVKPGTFFVHWWPVMMARYEEGHYPWSPRPTHCDPGWQQLFLVWKRVAREAHNLRHGGVWLQHWQLRLQDHQRQVGPELSTMEAEQ